MPTALKDSQVSIRLPAELHDGMETYARLTGRTKSYVAMEALRVYLDERMPQIEDLKVAVQEADQARFASDAEVQAVVARHASGNGGSEPATRARKPATARRPR